MRNALVIILLLLATTPIADAGILSWLTSRTVGWEFIQQTGGLRVHDPIVKDGRILLPIEYDPSGTTAITRQPELVNSGLMVRKIKAERKAQLLMLEVVVSTSEKGTKPQCIHYVDMSRWSGSKYVVVYGIMTNKAVRLGEFTKPDRPTTATSSGP